ncbi:rhamnan synthesis F family protein [Stella sp.]|uniref:rhamnan synthesis F family protein n=1 Tax=Stella sp. TaxID=2912054 RepID=UPI0035AF160C
MRASVVVPVFNHRRFVAAALWSVHAQGWQDLELVVVDDASTDGSADLVAELADDPRFAARFRRLQIVRAARNRGAAATIEHGLALASGEVLAILNSDDAYQPERLEACIAALEGGAALAFSGIACVDAGDRPDHSPLAARLAGLPASVGDHPTVATAFLGVNRAVSSGNLVFTRDLHRRVGGFRDLPLCHDWDFVLGACLQGEPVLVDRPLYRYRLHGANSFHSLTRQAQAEGEAVVGRFLEAVRCGRVGNPALAAIAAAPGVLDRLLRVAGPGVAEVARAIDQGRRPRQPGETRIPAAPSSALDRFLPAAAPAPDAPGRPLLLVVIAACDRGADAVLALNLAGHLRRTHDLVLVALEGGPLLDTLQLAHGRVLVADRRRAGEPGRLRELVDTLLERGPPTAAILVGAQPSELHDRLAERLVPTVLIARDADDLAPAARCTAVVAARPSLELPADMPARIAPIGPSEFSMARSRDAMRAELGRLRAELGRSGRGGDPPLVIGFGPLEPADGVRRFAACAAALRNGRAEPAPQWVWIGTGRAIAETGPWSPAGVTILPGTESNEAALHLADLVLATADRGLPLAALDATARGVPVLALAGSAAAAVLAATPEAILADPAALAAAAAEILAAGGRRHPLAARQRAATEAGATMAGLAAAVGDMAAAASARLEQVRHDIATLAGDERFDPAFLTPAGAHIEARAEAARRHLVAGPGAGVPRRPFPGFHPGIYAAAAGAGPGDPGARFLRAGGPPGPWQREVICPSLRPVRCPEGLRVAVHLHAHHPDVAPDLLRRLPPARDLAYELLVTTDEAAKGRQVADAAAAAGLPAAQVRVVPNRGRNLGALLCAWDPGWHRRYDLVGHFHTKRSPHLPGHAADGWRSFLLENLLAGVAPMVAAILARFAADPALGLVHADDPRLFGWNWHDPAAGTGDAAASFGAETNLAIARRLAPKLGLGPLPTHIEFPVGAMFWARPDALAPLLDLDLAWDDLPPEPLPLDGTILHAIERLLVLVAEARGYRTAVTHIPGVRL